MPNWVFSIPEILCSSMCPCIAEFRLDMQDYDMDRCTMTVEKGLVAAIVRTTSSTIALDTVLIWNLREEGFFIPRRCRVSLSLQRRVKSNLGVKRQPN